MNGQVMSMVFACRSVMTSNTTINGNKPAAPSDHLANERTFLAWIRTSIALMGFGFVIFKFALFVRQVAFALGKEPNVSGNGYSGVIGFVMIAIGGLTATLAYLRYRNIEKQLRNDSYFPSQWLSMLVTITIVIGSILLAIYLLPRI